MESRLGQEVMQKHPERLSKVWKDTAGRWKKASLCSARFWGN